MTVSTRTPEGQPGKCPLCDAAIVVELSVLFGDAICPQCGHLVWFFQAAEVTHVFDSQKSVPSRERVSDIVAERLGVDSDLIVNNPTFVSDLGVDSLDLVELVMELEEELNLP